MLPTNALDQTAAPVGDNFATNPDCPTEASGPLPKSSDPLKYPAKAILPLRSRLRLFKPTPATAVNALLQRVDPDAVNLASDHHVPLRSRRNAVADVEQTAGPESPANLF